MNIGVCREEFVDALGFVRGEVVGDDVACGGVLRGREDGDSGSRSQGGRPMNYVRQSMANGWTPERRARQAELIRNWKPWARSTGPRTAVGKSRVSQNAFKGGMRETVRQVQRLLRRMA